MANVPIVNGVVKVTAKDINGNNIQKIYSLVSAMNFDYNKGMVNIVDATGSFYFPLTPMTTVTYTIVGNPGGSHTTVMS